MAVNYVKFQRGSQAAYDLLKKNGQLDNNTLYFIYPENDASVGALYMGERIISGGDIVLESAYLDDLKDVIASEAGQNSFLVRDGENWIAKSLDDVANLISNYLDVNVDFDENQFALDDAGAVGLLGFKEAQSGAHLVKNADGKVAWEKPDNTLLDSLSGTVSNLANKLNGLETAVDSKADKSNVYTKQEVDSTVSNLQTLLDAKANVSDLSAKADKADVYTKEEANSAISAAVANAAHLKREIFESKILAENAMADYGEKASEYIYMVARVDNVAGNHYDEYMAFKGSDGVWNLERVGDWDIDLSAYAKTTDVAVLLNQKVDAVEGHRLITSEEAKKLESLSIGDDGSVGISGTVNASNVQELYNTVKKIVTETGTSEFDGEQKNLLGIAPGAQVNVIDSVDETELTIDENKKLSIKGLPSSKITDLSSLLNAKADKASVDALGNRVTAIEGMLIWGEMEEPTT